MSAIGWTILVLIVLLIIYVGSIAATYAARWLAPIALVAFVTTVVALAIYPQETTRNLVGFANWLGNRVQIIENTLRRAPSFR
ncbi:MAG: hypothetical protein IAF58_05460 [Leptolyngbya sp.]|nr:hypothetical protein [Candidatus Melainabacteria bacterium]